MSTAPIKNAGDVYQFVGDLKVEAKQNGMAELAIRLENALRLGSSGLEILGAVRQTIVDNGEAIVRLLGTDGKNRADQVVTFVDKAFGR